MRGIVEEKLNEGVLNCCTFDYSKQALEEAALQEDIQGRFGLVNPSDGLNGVGLEFLELVGCDSSAIGMRQHDVGDDSQKIGFQYIRNGGIVQS